MWDSKSYTDGSEISPVGLHPGHVCWNNLRDVAVKVQAAHTTERCYGSVGTNYYLAESRRRSQIQGTRVRDRDFERDPVSGTLQCDVCLLSLRMLTFFSSRRTARHVALASGFKHQNCKQGLGGLTAKPRAALGFAASSSALCAAGGQTRDACAIGLAGLVCSTEQDR